MPFALNRKEEQKARRKRFVSDYSCFLSKACPSSLPAFLSPAAGRAAPLPGRLPHRSLSLKVKAAGKQGLEPPRRAGRGQRYLPYPKVPLHTEGGVTPTAHRGPDCFSWPLIGPLGSPGWEDYWDTDSDNIMADSGRSFQKLRHIRDMGGHPVASFRCLRLFPSFTGSCPSSKS